jgi:hypothetical protein
MLAAHGEKIVVIVNRTTKKPKPPATDSCLHRSVIDQGRRCFDVLFGKTLGFSMCKSGGFS